MAPWEKAKLGNPSGNLPMSPTVLTDKPMPMLIALNANMATSGDGTALVRRGKR